MEFVVTNNAEVLVLKSPFYGLYLFENTYEQEPKLHNQSIVRYS